MSLFSGPGEHASNPPETWQVQKITPRCWALTTKDAPPYTPTRGWGHATVLSTFPRRKDAAMAKTVGFWFDLWHKEARWYAGETLPNWKPYAVVAAEHARIAARREEANR